MLIPSLLPPPFKNSLRKVPLVNSQFLSDPCIPVCTVLVSARGKPNTRPTLGSAPKYVSNQKTIKRLQLYSARMTRHTCDMKFSAFSLTPRHVSKYGYEGGQVGYPALRTTNALARQFVGNCFEDPTNMPISRNDLRESTKYILFIYTRIPASDASSHLPRQVLFLDLNVEMRRYRARSFRKSFRASNTFAETSSFC